MKGIKIAAASIMLLLFTASCTVQQPTGNMQTSPPASADSQIDDNNSSTPEPSEENAASTAPADSSNPPTADYSKINRELSAFLPQDKGFEWRYFGYAEYGHSMTLDAIDSAIGGTAYRISGKVDDMSGEASDESLSIAIEYEIAQGKLIQNNIKGKNMDSDFKSIVLLEGPLEKGASWNQKVYDRNNAEIELDCSIKDVINDGCKTLVVRYQQKDSEYYEERIIREGWGVVGFTKLFIYGSDKSDIGFSLYDDMSGYTGERELKMLLPPRMNDMRYNGLAEYGHVAKWENTFLEPDRITYEITGYFDDGSGIPGSFRVHYILDRNNFTVTEKVMENTRSGERKINSIIPDQVILKAPLTPGSSWQQQVSVGGNEYTMAAMVTGCTTSQNDPSSLIYSIRYTIEGIPGYFNNTFIQERKFETRKGMTGFTQLMPGDIGLSGKDLEDKAKVEEALVNHMFGYGLSLVN